MRPDFGCGIHELVFARHGQRRRCSASRSVVEDALRRYEARIEVIGRQRRRGARLTDGSLRIELDYRVRKTNQIGNLVFPFYFREGGQR